MSGGVDSSTTAALLQEQGYDVVGVTLRLYDQSGSDSASKACCAGKDIEDARRVAEHLGVPHYVLDFENRFTNEVIAPFADSYARGETPVPCVLCNQTVKFRDLLDAARLLGAKALATGHYVRRVMGPDGAELHRADPVRDQSYFLFATTREQLEFLRFPLGEMNKDETRALARRFDLPVAEKSDSPDICFVPDGDYGRLVRNLRPAAAQPGDIVHVDGRILGRHEGIVHFTVGQRRGIGVGGGDALYVVRLQADTNQVVVGPRSALLCARFTIGGVNWLGAGPSIPATGVSVTARMRSTQTPVAAMVYGRGGELAEVVLNKPFEAVAPGQACALYDGERLLGGGWILRDVDDIMTQQFSIG